MSAGGSGFMHHQLIRFDQSRHGGYDLLFFKRSPGTGPVYLFRWYWWRVNAWSEVSAMVAAFCSSLALRYGAGLNADDPLGFAWLMLWTVFITALCWVGVTYWTGPEPTDHLLRFYRKVRPCPYCWTPMARLAPEVASPDRPGMDFLRWILGCVLVYSALFGIGKLLMGQLVAGTLLLAVAVLLTTIVMRGIRRGRSSPDAPSGP